MSWPEYSNELRASATEIYALHNAWTHQRKKINLNSIEDDCRVLTTLEAAIVDRALKLARLVLEVHKDGTNNV